MIVAVFISDRGDRYLPGCLTSYLEHVEPVVDDMTVIDDRDHHLGMAGAVQAGFEWALSTGADYVWWVEEDFIFEAPILLGKMRTILDLRPHLAQLVLKRQPWSPEEKASGGIIEMNPSAYTECGDWVEHELLFSLNPCLIPRRILELEWSTTHPGGVERAITNACLDAGLKFGYFGRKDDPPRCAHVGYERSTGYRW